MILLIAAPAAAATRLPAPPRNLFDVPRPAAPPRDVVLSRPSAAAARISASASGERYPVNDGSEDSIAVSVTAACQATCTAADPQQIANFVGTLIHGNEINLLTVQLDTPFQVGFDCGFDAESCYYSGLNKIVLSGDETVDSDGASRDYVLAHEYGHHVAQHRGVPPPFPAAINWGPERWSSYEHVCRGRRSGALFPGNEGTHYYQDPGEAWAESFAHYRFPEAPVKWEWIPSLKPNAAAFRAIREDTLHPWRGRTSFKLRGLAAGRGGAATVESFRTPLDGEVSLGPVGEPGLGYQLSLSNPSGKVLRSSRRGATFHHRLDYTVCGQPRLRVAVRSTRPGADPFRLTVQRP
ncbi:MAG TPA: hypothetical protein VNY83_09135 [Solirubrobacterales bacterium]|jgi:hypothetical protein|nr:hypothetical protein [Solirubrobacterales bacterium]